MTSYFFCKCDVTPITARIVLGEEDHKIIRLALEKNMNN